MSKKILELAGFADEEGNLGRYVPTGRIIVPEYIRLEGDVLRWGIGRFPRVRDVSKSMLNEFIRITDGDSVLRFAVNWGVLGFESGKVLFPSRSFDSGGGEEPISVWQYYSRRLSAVLNVAAALKQGRLGDLRDWGEFSLPVMDIGPAEREIARNELARRAKYGLGLGLHVGSTKPEDWVDRLATETVAKRTVAEEVTNWLDCWKLGRTRKLSDLEVEWNEDTDKWELGITYHGFLFPAIALQLALVVADVDSLFTCSGCGIPYVRPRERRRPKFGWANYCEECGKNGRARRMAVEKYRRKQSEAVRMVRDGLPTEEIAQKLEVDLSRVVGWLKKAGVYNAKT